MRSLLLFAALGLSASGLAACDSSGPDPVPYDGIIEVSLARDSQGRAVLRLVAVDDRGCDDPLRVETVAATPARLDVRVVGIVPPADGTCLAIVPASTVVPLPFTEQGGFPVTVAHRGSTDEYAYSIGFAGERFDAVRTTTTRLATP